MKKENKARQVCLSFLLGISIVLCGCGKADLLSNISEEEANDVMSILQQANLPATKKAGAESTWTVVINDVNNFSKAVELLKSKGFPKVNFDNVGKIFQKSGLVSSPLEERARLMYAMAETISETLSEIPGVLTARVHVVLPENDPYAEGNIPSSAAVFITYRAEANVEESVREIKYLVTNSIQGLSYDRVSVALFPVAFQDVVDKGQATNLVSSFGIMISPDSVTRLWSIIGILALLLCAAAATAVFLGYLHFHGIHSTRHGKDDAPVAVQLDVKQPEAKASEDQVEDENSDDEGSLGSVE